MQLELRGLCKRFGEKEVLRGVSFCAESGSAFGLLGRNGAGKTTAIRILMNVFPADAGEILLDGAPIDRTRVRFGYLPEERGLYPKKKVLEQLVYFAQLHGLSRREAVASVDRLLERLGMTEYRNRRLDTLSKGNQQKIQLISALVHDPQIVVLDEPFSGLDPVNALLFKQVVREEVARGKTVLFSSHQMNYIEEFCDRIAILNGGEVVLQGKLSDIRRSYPRDRLVVRTQEAARLQKELGERCTMQPDGSLLLLLPDAAKKPEAMRALSERYDIDEIRVFEPSLNDIFVQYAGERV